MRALLLGVSVLAAGCGTSESSEANTTTIETDNSATTSAAPQDTPSTNTETTVNNATVIEVEVKDSEIAVTPSDNVTIAKDSEVEIIVNSDRDEFVHVHSYEFLEPLKAGEPLNITFTADKQGQFEVELEDSGVELFRFSVS